MAYGQSAMRPGKSSQGIKPLSYPETKKMQKGKTGMEGASEDAKMNFGGMPSSGPVQANAGGPSAKGGSTTKSGGANSSRGAQVTHASQKAPLKPASKGGANVGSVDTMTKLIFHPKGGLGRGKTSKTPGSAPGYKDSGAKGGVQKTGVSQ